MLSTRVYRLPLLRASGERRIYTTMGHPLINVQHFRTKHGYLPVRTCSYAKDTREDS